MVNPSLNSFAEQVMHESRPKAHGLRVGDTFKSENWHDHQLN